MHSRRQTLKNIALLTSGFLLANRTQASPTIPKKYRANHKEHFTLGVATVSLKTLPLENMMLAVKRIGLEHISIHRAHAPWDSSREELQKIASKLRNAGLQPMCAGVIYLTNDETAMRKMFDYVRALDISLFTCSPEPSALPLLEKLVKEYDLRAAIHNHGPEDKSYPTPDSVWTAISHLDSRIGMCLDIGHCYRSGLDPAIAIHRYKTRLFDIHLKDSIAPIGADDIPVEMGRGNIDLTSTLTALKDIHYKNYAWLEYEKDPDDPLLGLTESLGFTRGLLKGLSDQ